MNEDLRILKNVFIKEHPDAVYVDGKEGTDRFDLERKAATIINKHRAGRRPGFFHMLDCIDPATGVMAVAVFWSRDRLKGVADLPEINMKA
jgi:hypothetical protein